MAVSKKVQQQLPRIKRNVEDWQTYFERNYKRFHEYNRFIFYTSITADDASTLEATGKPQLEFNTSEAFISKRMGEFAKNQPGVKVMASDLPEEKEKINAETLDVYSGHLRHIFNKFRKCGDEYSTFQDAMGGGFGVIKVRTDYTGEKSFVQNILLERAFSPVLCGFDPLAQRAAKEDGNFCFEIYPRTKERFQEENPDVNINDIKFVRENSGFNWSYNSNEKDILLVCDYYEKKKKKTKLYELANGKTYIESEYEKFVSEWDTLLPLPAIVNERKTQITTICRYRFISNQIIEYIETDYPCLPLIFVDGNSRQIQESDGGDIKQVTRPYAYQIKDAQRLKNFAGQSLANDLENSIQHKWRVAQEALPSEEEYLDAYTDVQKSKVLVYNQFYENDPSKQVNPPEAIVRPPIPPEFTNTFVMCDSLMQNILGSFDAALGIQGNQISGDAIEAGATNSNMAAMPYEVNYHLSLTQAAKLIVGLMPLYITQPRSLPIIDKEGKEKYVRVNEPGKPQLTDSSNSLGVEVEAGASFQIQKNIALKVITSMMGASPLFAQFINSEGLDVLVNNMTIDGIDQLKEKAKIFMQNLKAQQAQAAQMAAQNNPDMMKAKIEQMKLAWQAEKEKMQAQIEVEHARLEKEKLENEKLKLMLQAHDDAEKRAMQKDQHETQKTVELIKLQKEIVDMKHSHEMEKADFHHKVNSGGQNHETRTE